jgi:hypothetical protein
MSDDAPSPMTEAETRFAERLTEDIERVLGPGLTVDRLEIVGRGPVSVRLACSFDGGEQELSVTESSVITAYPVLMRAVAELRLGAAWRRLVRAG